MKILLSGGRVLDPESGTDAVKNVWITDGVITAVSDSCCEQEREQADRVIDAGGCWVAPGLIDLHVHLREPGFEQKETIETGTAAMAHGGYTSVCPMPNTLPATDSPERIEWLVNKAAQVSPIHVLPIGAVTLGQQGDTVADIAGMKRAGAVAISEDGKSVMDSGIYRRAMREAAKQGLVVMAHCEDKTLVEGGCINMGKKSEELQVAGISNAVEDIIVARDILLAKETGAALHLCHCSTRDSVKMVAAAKRDGVRVTAEVCPHHFVLCDEDIVGDDSNYKMNPPLRSRQDMEALIRGLADGTIDTISTDHAPHTREEKQKPISEAPFGITGSETALSLSLTYLVDTGVLTPLQLIEKMSYAPAKILGSDRGRLKAGAPADVVVIDPEAVYEIREEDMLSKGKNSPFIGRTVKGRVLFTICDGTVVYEA